MLSPINHGVPRLEVPMTTTAPSPGHLMQLIATAKHGLTPLLCQTPLSQDKGQDKATESCGLLERHWTTLVMEGQARKAVLLLRRMNRSRRFRRGMHQATISPLSGRIWSARCGEAFSSSTMRRTIQGRNDEFLMLMIMLNSMGVF